MALLNLRVNFLALIITVVAASTSTEPPACVQVAMFKDSSSGSSWFLQQMNALPGVALKNELLVARTAGRGAEKNTNLAVSALKPACGAKQSLSGFSLNPHHAAGVDWPTVRARRPEARVLVWDRTNWVKKVASAVLFEQKGCRHHNIRTTREARRCHHRKPTTIPVEDFLGRVRGEACDSAALYSLGTAFANDTQVVVATYEAFRADAGAELTRVFRELGLDASAARKTPPRTMKRSPEALSRVFANHKDLARALKRWAPKGCRLEGMILDTKGTRAFRCNAARACDHFRELERACRGGGEC